MNSETGNRISSKTLGTRITGPFRWFWKTSWITKVIIVGATILVAFLVNRQIRGGASTVEYNFETVKRDNVVRIVSETGEVMSTGRVDVQSSITGIVEEVYVKNSDQVEKDQRLFKVVSTASKAERASAYSSYMSALNNVKVAEQNKVSAKSQLESARKAVYDAQNAVDAKNSNIAEGKVNPATQKAYTQNEIDSIDSALKSARIALDAANKTYHDADSAIEAAKAALNSAKISYQSTINGTVEASVAGTVANLSVAKGDKVQASPAASTQTTQATQTTVSSPALMIITDPTSWIKVPINETDVQKLKVGQQANIDLDAVPDKTFKGQVNRIDRVGTSTQGVVTYDVYVTVLNAEPQIQPAMTANVEVETDRKDNVLTVSNGALKPYKGGKAIQIMNKKTGKPVFKLVKVGIAGVLRTEIISGVREGQRIVTGVKNPQGSSQGIFGGGG